MKNKRIQKKMFGNMKYTKKPISLYVIGEGILGFSIGLFACSYLIQQGIGIGFIRTVSIVLFFLGLAYMWQVIKKYQRELLDN